MSKYLTILIINKMGKKQKKERQYEEDSQNSKEFDSNQQQQSSQNQQLDQAGKRAKKIKKREKRSSKQTKNKKVDTMTKQYFQSIYTSFEQSIFFKINDSQAEDIKNRIINNPQPNNAENAQFGTKVRLASIAGSILSDPNLQTEQQIKDTASRVTAMLFTIYEIDIESLNLFQLHVGSKLQNNAKVIFVTHRYKQENQPPFSRNYTIIQTDERNVQQKIQDFDKTKRLLLIVKFNLHGKLRLIKFGQNQSLRVCVTSSNMSFIDYNIGGNVFWARDFQPSPNKNYQRQRHEKDFMDTLNQFLSLAVSQQPADIITDINRLVNNIFPLDHFKYDRVKNLKLILCHKNLNTQSTNNRYGLAKIETMIRNSYNQARYRAKRIVNIVSPFKYCSERNQGKYQRLLLKMLSAFGSVTTPLNNRLGLDTNKKLRINQLTPADYYIHNKYEGQWKQEMLHNQNHSDILRSLVGMNQAVQNRGNALDVIRGSGIAQFHKFQRLQYLKPSNYTPHHTKMVICTARGYRKKTILYRDILFIGSQNLTLSSWGQYSEDGQKINYTTLQLGVLIIGFGNEYTQNYLPFKIDNYYNQNPLPYQDIAQCRINNLNRHQQLQYNFGEQLNVQKKFFKYLKQMKQWFTAQFSKVGNNNWEIHLYYPITSLPTQNQVHTIQFNEYQDYEDAVINGGLQFLANYNNNIAKGFYIADAVFIKKEVNNDKVIKYIVNLKSKNPQVSCPQFYIERILQQFKPGNQVQDILQFQQHQLHLQKQPTWQLLKLLLTQP